MKNKDLKISVKLLWSLIAGFVLLIIGGAFSKILQLESSTLFFAIGLLLFFTSWIIVMSDISRSEINNKSIWIKSMIIFPAFCPVIYLVRREKLMNIAE